MWFINLMWILLNYLFQANVDDLIGFSILGYIFLIPFLGVLVMQILAMCWHRLGVLQQLLSITEIHCFKKQKKQKGVDITKELSKELSKLTHMMTDLGTGLQCADEEGSIIKSSHTKVPEEIEPPKSRKQNQQNCGENDALGHALQQKVDRQSRLLEMRDDHHSEHRDHHRHRRHHHERVEI